MLYVIGNAGHILNAGLARTQECPTALESNTCLRQASPGKNDGHSFALDRLVMHGL